MDSISVLQYQCIHLGFQVVPISLGEERIWSTGLTLFEEQAKWVLRSPTQFDSRSQNRFCLYLDPLIGPFGLRRHVRFSFSEKFISCSAQQQSGFFIQHFQTKEGNAHFQYISCTSIPFFRQICRPFQLYYKFLSFHKYGVLKNKRA